MPTAWRTVEKRLSAATSKGVVKVSPLFKDILIEFERGYTEVTVQSVLRVISLESAIAS